MIASGNHAPRGRRGQAVIFLVTALVILFFVVLWGYDVHKIIHVKAVSQNGGDAAALMAARWQGITLNLVGDLNIMQALALTAGDAVTSSAVTNIQARLCYVGPMIGFLAAQQAAKNNGIFVNEDFTALLQEHAQRVRNDYPSQSSADGEMLFPEPYPGCWEEYAQMLDLVADEGVAAGPDNAAYYGDALGGHILLDPGFYEAVAGRYWCWFHHHAPALLEDYTDYRWWPPLPEITNREFINSEIFGLRLTKLETSLASLIATNDFIAADRERGVPAGLSAAGADAPAAWYCYGRAGWGAWEAMDTSGAEPFPLTGTVKPQYDYAGADAAVRVVSMTGRLTPGAGGSTVSNAITWTAAAKPFGYLAEDLRPNAFDLVLPAFREVRLIPVDASSAPSGGAYDLAWRRHVENHLPEYLRDGPRSSACPYCRQLVTWEDPAFRREGADWLEENWRLCVLPSGPGPGSRGGGTRRGH